MGKHKAIMLAMQFWIRGSIYALVGLTALKSLATPANSDPRIDKAKLECAAGNVPVGIWLLAELYTQTNLSVFIYNQGRCYEQNGMREQAISRFEEYLRIERSLTPTDVADIRARIAGLQGAIDQKAKLAPTPATPTVQLFPAPTDSLRLPPPVDVAEPARLKTEGSDGSGQRTAAVITGIAGVVALGGGVVCNLKAKRLKDELNTLQVKHEWNQGKEDRRKIYSTAGWVGYSIGAAALITGFTLYGLGSRNNIETPSSVSIIPAFLPGVLAISARGTY